MVNVDVFRIILDIYPRVEGVNFTDVPDDDTTLAFLIKLGYKEAIKQSESYQMFIKYSTSRIPPKKSRGKGSQRKKTTYDSQETIDVSEESKPKPESVKRKTSGNSISQTKVEEVEAARQVHATHARIVTKSVPESTKKKSGGRSSKSVINKRLQTLCKLLKKVRRQARDSQWGSEQESEYSEEDKLDDEEKDDKEGDADDEDDETESDEDDIYKYKIRVRKDEDEEMINAKVDDSDKGDEEINDAAKADAEKNLEVKDDPKKAELPLTSSSLSVSLGFGDPFLKLSSDSSLVSTVKDTTDAEINSLLEVKIQSEVPHTQSLSMLSVPVSVISEPIVLTPVQESPSIATVTTLPPSSVSTTPSIPQQTTTPIPTPTITTKAPIITTAILESDALSVIQLRVVKLEKDVFKLKNIDLSVEALIALKTQVPFVIDYYLRSKVGDVFQKELEKHTVDLIQKYSLQQALMEALIEDENAMDKEVADIVQDHKRKHDDDDDDNDDDDKYPPAGPNQGKQTKRRRTKESESSKKPSPTKETQKGKAPSKGSKTGKSALAKEPVRELISEVVMDDVGDNVVHDDQPQDDSEPKTTKTPNQEWFKQPLRPPTPDLEWNKRQVVLDQPKQPWFNQMVSATNDPLTFNDLMATPIDFSKYVLNGLKIDNFTQDILLDLIGIIQKEIVTLFDLSKPLPLQGPPCHRTFAVDYFFNNDLEYLKNSDPVVTYTTSITKTKAARYEIEGIEDMVPTLWSPTKVGYDKDALKGIKH
ncbi:hypothetical protein Tco_1372111 [Tanacetum coccineum]